MKGTRCTRFWKLNGHPCSHPRVPWRGRLVHYLWIGPRFSGCLMSASQGFLLFNQRGSFEFWSSGPPRNRGFPRPLIPKVFFLLHWNWVGILAVKVGDHHLLLWYQKAIQLSIWVWLVDSFTLLMRTQNWSIIMGTNIVYPWVSLVESAMPTSDKLFIPTIPKERTFASVVSTESTNNSSCPWRQNLC